MRAVSINPFVLGFSLAYAGAFVVLSLVFWHVLEQPTLAVTVGLMNWYLGALLAAVLLVVGHWYMCRSHVERLVPRFYIASFFVAWIVLQVAPHFVSDVSTFLFIKLLEAPVLLLLFLTICYRIRTVFTPLFPRTVLVLSTITGLVLAILLAPSTLNHSLTVADGVARAESGVGYTILIGFAFLILIVSLVLVITGRQRYRERPSYSVGPLVFEKPQQAQDHNIYDLLDRLIAKSRKQAIKRGQWIYFKNHIDSLHGIVSTEPKACENALETLVEYALHKNQSRAISIELLPDTRYQYLHITLRYTVNTHTKTEFTEYETHFRELGGVLTIERDKRETTMVVSFPVHW